MWLVVALLPCVLADGHGFYKSLQGPPSSFKQHRVPDPSQALLESFSSMLPLALSGDVFKASFAVDSLSRATVFFFSPLLSTYSVSLAFPNGTVVSADPEAASLPVSDSGDGAPGLSWQFERPVRGNWSFLLRRSGGKAHEQQTEPVHAMMPNAFLSVQNEGSEAIVSHLSSYSLERGEMVGVVSRIARASESSPAAAMRAPRVTHAELDVITPDSRRLLMRMHDDGLHADGAAGDGVYGGSFNATLSGLYKATAVLGGTMGDGSPFARSTTHLMRVVHDDVELALRDAQLTAEKQLLQIRIPVTGNSAVDTVYRVYAEVQADLMPVAWAGGMAAKQCSGEQCYLEVEVHSQWFKDAGITSSALFGVSLQHVTIYDKDSNVPVSQRAHIKVRHEAAKLAAVLATLPTRGKAEPPTEAMLMGNRPARLRRGAAKRNATLPTLVLVHGWCATIQPWEGQEEFDNAVLFKDLKQNRPTAQFAELLAAATAELLSFGLVGHSQGGLASLHLHNYIWSGLESAVGERKIQSVGTPYLGSAGAGSSADTIKIFGYGCGASFDLSIDGAALWQTGIQTEARKDVFFYRTQWADKGLIKYCNLASNAVLSWPNDGMAEVKRGELAGGNDMGIFKGECHTFNMKYEAQYRSVDRNTILNAKAAR